MKEIRYPFLLGIVFACLPSTASAAAFSLHTVMGDEGFVVPMLEATSQRYVDAMRTVIATRFPDDHDALAWEELEEHMRDARVARFEYRYTKDGVAGRRIYHAIDGEPLGAVAQRILDAPGRVVSVDSGDDGDSDGGYYDVEPEPIDEEALSRVEERDRPAYTGFRDDEVRAPFSASRGSVLSTGHLGGRHRALDAEFKALRAIELDMRAGIVPETGGEVIGMVSGSVCAACRHAGETFAAEMDTPVTITQMFNAIHPSQRNALIAAGKARARGTMLINTATGRPWLAADALAGARDSQVRKALNPTAVERSRAGKRLPGRRFRLGPVNVEASGTDAPPGC